MSIEKIKCRKCGYELFPSDKKCEKCGTSVVEELGIDEDIEIVSLDNTSSNEDEAKTETTEKKVTEKHESDEIDKAQSNEIKDNLDNKLVNKTEKSVPNKKGLSKTEKKSYKGVIIGTIAAVIVIALVSILIPNFSIIFHRHTWVEATCETPAVCSECGEIEGEALGHDFLAATCELPATCSRCGLTQGDALGHVYEETPCNEKKICTRCGQESSEPAGHLVEVGVCEKCGLFQGEEKLFELAKCWHDVVQILNGKEPDDISDDVETNTEDEDIDDISEEETQAAIEKAASDAENKSRDDMYNDICTRIYRYQNALDKLDELLTICADSEPLQNIKVNTQSLIDSIPSSYIQKEEEEMLVFMQNENNLIQTQKDINDEVMALIGVYLDTATYAPENDSVEENPET